jgi:hypothetical protein
MRKTILGSLKRRGLSVALLVAVGVLGFSAVAAADTVGSINFESSQGYAPGNINGQGTDPANTWSKTGPYDVNVVDNARLGFGQALQISNAVTSGSFGDQAFSPGLTDPAGVSAAKKRFDATFQIGTTSDAVQPGLMISVSPDNGQGARTSYLRFEDQTDGVHVLFNQARGATFKESDIATLIRTEAHTVKFSIDFGAASSKAVTIAIDGVVKATGSTWDGYYQTQEHNPKPTVSKMLFRAGGTAATGTFGSGFLIDNLTLTSS